MLRAVLFAVLACVAATAEAWSEAGHRIISSIAFRQLTPEEQAKIVAILKHHPRFADDFQAKMPKGLDENEQNEFIFQQAGVWPDMARGFKGDDKKYDHPTWHYINLPLYLTHDDQPAMKDELKVNISLEPPAAEQEEMNIMQAITLGRRLVADSSTPDAQKAVILCWIFHCIGDIHQPLHSAAMFSVTLFPSGDRGGNSVKTAQKGNLHALWDQFLGNKAEYRTARNKAILMVNDGAKNNLGNAAAMDLNERTWLRESFVLAGSTVYDNEVIAGLRAYAGERTSRPISLTKRYLTEGGRVAEQRVIEAGYRLGAVLKQL